MHDSHAYFYTKDLVALYIEDDAALSNVAYPIFDALFKTVYFFGNSKQAYSFWLENYESIDIIFTDIVMPEMSGIELCKKVLHFVPYQKIVVVSADFHNELLLELVNVGISAFIRQPVDIDLVDGVLSKVGKMVVERKELLAYQKKLEDGYGVAPLEQATTHPQTPPPRIEPQPMQPKLEPIISQPPQEAPPKPRVKPTKQIIHEQYSLEDTAEMREIIDDIDYLLIKLFEHGKMVEEFEPYMIKLISCYTNYAMILKSYPSFEFLSTKLSELSLVLNDILVPNSLENISFVAEILESMTHSFVLFHRHIIEEKLYAPNFYDASLANDIDFIIATIRPSKSLPSEEVLVEFF